jgi:hypothetical protein
MTDIVECHSGFTYAERPTALTWQGQQLIIAEILSQGRTPQAKWFRVKTTDGQLFELSYVDATNEQLADHEWQIQQV